VVVSRAVPFKRKKKSSPKAAPKVPKVLEYKIQEISAVDESSLERCINEWVPQGWNFDGVQFAMRESSKRPAMGFVFFTRETTLTPTELRSPARAQERLKTLSSDGDVKEATTAWERLQQLAEREP
jgi:hypothetical protein